MQKKKLFFSGILLCLVILAATGFYWYQKPRSGLKNIQPDYTLSAQELYKSFQEDENKANKQFLEKVILVKGAVDNVQSTGSTLNILLSGGNETGGINCSIIKNNIELIQPAKGTTMQLKGRCVGFLIDVNLVDAVIEP